MDPRSTVGYLQMHPIKMGSITCDPIGYGTKEGPHSWSIRRQQRTRCGVRLVSCKTGQPIPFELSVKRYSTAIGALARDAQCQNRNTISSPCC